MIVCPKCKVSNDDVYTFCVECGTPLTAISKESFEETIQMLFDKLPETVLIPPEKLPETVLMPPDKTVQMPNDKLAETHYYSPANTFENETPPTVLMPQEELPATVQQSLPTQQFTPSESVETQVSPTFKTENFETTTDDNKTPKKSKKALWIGGIVLLFLFGGVAIAYFLHQPPQSSRSYLLNDKHDADKVVEFDPAKNAFSMVSVNNNSLQKWQITPNPDDQNYYRFVNRGIGSDESLEVLDNNLDSSISMNKSAVDEGQLWTMTNVENDYYRITNKWLGNTKSLSHKKRYYFFLRLRDSNDNAMQLWKKIPANNGKFYLVNKQFGDKLSVEAIFDGDFKDKLVMKSGNSSNHQWQMADVGSGFYSLTNGSNNKSLDVNSDKNDRVKMNTLNGSGSQKWKMTPVGNDYFRLTNESLGDGKSLEAVSFYKYYMEMVKSADNDPGQLWKLPRIDK